MEGVGYMGRYDDGSSPYDPSCAGMGGKGVRDGVVGVVRHSSVPDESLRDELRREEAMRMSGWSFPTGSAEFLG